MMESRHLAGDRVLQAAALRSIGGVRRHVRPRATLALVRETVGLAFEGGGLPVVGGLGRVAVPLGHVVVAPRVVFAICGTMINAHRLYIRNYACKSENRQERQQHPS